jgi:glycosyltransferase involved in cell wall biosynthesis
MANVSVIIPTYNSAKFILESLNSAIQQTYKDIEIIVVDDGSTDNTKQVLAPFMDKICYIYKDNGGAASARNTGIKHATGKYIAFLDADDIWLPEKLELQMKLFSQNKDIDWIHTNLILIDESGIEQGIRKLPPDFATKDIFYTLFMEYWTLTSSIIIKRGCLDIVGEFDESLPVNQDYDLWLRMAHHYKIGYIDQPLTKYRIHQAQNTKKIDLLCYCEKKVIEKAIRNFPQLANQSKLLNIRFGKLFFDWGHRHFDLNNLQMANEKFKIALNYQPLNIKYLIYYLSTLFNLPQIIRAIRRIKQYIRYKNSSEIVIKEIKK